MPSFLAKVGRSFIRKRPEPETAASSSGAAKKRNSIVSLLDGQKFEAVAKPASVSATKIAETAQEKHSGKDKRSAGGHGDSSLVPSFLRPKSPTPSASNKTPSNRDVPHLSLNLPDIKEDGKQDLSLDAVFEAAGEGKELKDWKTINAKRLSSAEALRLVEESAKSVKSRGLETLGIMHPNWYASSVSEQRKIISYFFDALSSKDSIAASPFTSELQYSRSPHDPAAVLRWGLRHLDNKQQPFGNAKGGSTGEWDWYNSFSQAERSTSFPLDAFSKSLLPLLVEPNIKLLTVLMDVTASLASQSELNGISGSKLCKILGYWLLSTRSAQDQGWAALYDDWDAAGRILEHIFLAFLRDESVHPKMPRRLQELVKSYPYSKEHTGIFLAKPRFTTRIYDALLVQIDVRRQPGHEKSVWSARRLVEESLKADISQNIEFKDEVLSFWKTLRDSASSASESIANGQQNGSAEGNTLPLRRVDFSLIFTDDTIRMLDLQQQGDSENPVSPTTSMFSTSLPSPGLSPTRRRSLSLNDVPATNGKSVPPPSFSHAMGKAPTTSASPISTGLGVDWGSFSASGFFENDPTIGSSLAATLLDKDTEISSPASRKSSTRKRLSMRRGSMESSPSTPKPLPSPSAPSTEAVNVVACANVAIDEAFVDFWSDSLLDPVTSGWPSFAVCQLKASSGVQGDGPVISWLLVEAKHSVHAPSIKAEPAPPQSPTISNAMKRSTSASSKQTTNTTKPKKRFGFFSSTSNRTSVVAKGATKGTAIGEMGEILNENTLRPSEAPEPRPSESAAKILEELKTAAPITTPVPAVLEVSKKQQNETSADEAQAATVSKEGAPALHEPLAVLPVTPKGELVDEPPQPAKDMASAPIISSEGLENDRSEKPASTPANVEEPALLTAAELSPEPLTAATNEPIVAHQLSAIPAEDKESLGQIEPEVSVVATEEPHIIEKSPQQGESSISEMPSEADAPISHFSGSKFVEHDIQPFSDAPADIRDDISVPHAELSASAEDNVNQASAVLTVTDGVAGPDSNITSAVVPVIERQSSTDPMEALLESPLVEEVTPAIPNPQPLDLGDSAHLSTEDKAQLEQPAKDAPSSSLARTEVEEMPSSLEGPTEAPKANVTTDTGHSSLSQDQPEAVTPTTGDVQETSDLSKDEGDMASNTIPDAPDGAVHETDLSTISSAPSTEGFKGNVLPALTEFPSPVNLEPGSNAKEDEATTEVLSEVAPLSLMGAGTEQPESSLHSTPKEDVQPTADHANGSAVSNEAASLIVPIPENQLTSVVEEQDHASEQINPNETDANVPLSVLNDDSQRELSELNTADLRAEDVPVQELISNVQSREEATSISEAKEAPDSNSPQPEPVDEHPTQTEDPEHELLHEKTVTAAPSPSASEIRDNDLTTEELNS